MIKADNGQNFPADQTSTEEKTEAEETCIFAGRGPWPRLGTWSCRCQAGIRWWCSAAHRRHRRWPLIKIGDQPPSQNRALPEYLDQRITTTYGRVVGRREKGQKKELAGGKTEKEREKETKLAKEMNVDRNGKWWLHEMGMAWSFPGNRNTWGRFFVVINWLCLCTRLYYSWSNDNFEFSRTIYCFEKYVFLFYEF